MKVMEWNLGYFIKIYLLYLLFVFFFSTNCWQLQFPVSNVPNQDTAQNPADPNPGVLITNMNAVDWIYSILLELLTWP